MKNRVLLLTLRGRKVHTVIVAEQAVDIVAAEWVKFRKDESLLDTQLGFAFTDMIKEKFGISATYIPVSTI